MGQGVTAAIDWVDISIDHAYYYNLDADGIMDDVRIDMTCTVRDGAKNPGKSYYRVTLTLPSGTQYIVIIEVIGKYDVLHMTLNMYNTATEAGWYNVLVEGFAYGGKGYSSASYDFDPPEKTGSGPPSVDLIAWTS
jgi:hypothetical protein